MKLTKGRIPSLLAWGLLVGGVALLITFPEVQVEGELFMGAIPAALLFVLAGFVFGLSHPDGWDWTGALLLGWVPVVVAIVAVTTSARAPLSPGLLIVLPAALAALGSAAGAAMGRWRGRNRNTA